MQRRADLTYTLIRSDRRSISLRITPAGALQVRCPAGMPKREVEAFLYSKADWIQKHLAQLPPPQETLTGEELLALAAQAKGDIPQRVERFAGQLGAAYGRIAIRSQRSRWGSCSARGNLNFNCLLMLCPPEVRDYVVVHELCHLRELNHSPRFWALVAQILPGYREQRAWLKNHGSALISRLPEK